MSAMVKMRDPRCGRTGRREMWQGGKGWKSGNIGRERVCGRRVGGVWRDNLPPLGHQTPRHRRPITPINEINHLQIYLAFSFITGYC